MRPAWKKDVGVDSVLKRWAGAMPSDRHRALLTTGVTGPLVRPPSPMLFSKGGQGFSGQGFSGGGQGFSRGVQAHFTADRSFPAEAGSYADFPPSLHPSLADGLRRRGIEQLYTHQAAAFEAAHGGNHVVIATPTASGKSLCFHLPVLDALARDPTATAIYLYPTKALSRDQESGVRALIDDAGLQIPAVVYDGDTPGDARRAARQRSPIILTNPDMLHSGILPHHANWARTLQNLRYVVLDELHTYRGVFGSHVAHVLARLRRAAQFHGSEIRFLCATATIGNAQEHAARLLNVSEADIDVIDKSGAPKGARRVFVFNPPVVNAELGIRASYLKSAVRVARDLIDARVPTIVFGPSRNSIEIMLKYLRDGIRQSDDAVLAASVDTSIVGYRGGYLPDTRRRVENGLRSGDILCVVATNALELGIDIGELDAVVCAGYPGSIAETWQRFGRAGRRGGTSISVLISSSQSIDQYFAQNPNQLFDGSIEHARIDPANTEVVIQHLKCGAFELPFMESEAFMPLNSDDTHQALQFLEGHGVLHEADGRFHWATDAYPANHVSLRSVGWDNFVIIDKTTGRALAELDWRAAPTMLHEQAIYQHDAEQYQVEKLDYENHKAFVRRVDTDYFTTALTNRTVAVIEVAEQRDTNFQTTAAHGEISVVDKIVGYKKIKFHTHENAGYGDIRLPDIQMHTTSFWWTVPEVSYAALGLDRTAALEGMRGIGRALEMVTTIALMCDPRDIGQAIGDANVEPSSASGDGLAPLNPRFAPSIFLFDNIPGGVGLSPRIYERFDELLVRAAEVVMGCSCPGGCPFCVGASAIGNEAPRTSDGAPNRTIAPDIAASSPVHPSARKPASIALLRAVLAGHVERVSLVAATDSVAPLHTGYQ